MPKQPRWDRATASTSGGCLRSLAKVPRRSAVFLALQRGVDRGELRPDADLALIYDLLIGPLLMRSVVSGEQLGADMADKTVDAVLAAFGRGPKRRPPERSRPS